MLAVGLSRDRALSALAREPPELREALVTGAKLFPAIEL